MVAPSAQLYMSLRSGAFVYRTASSVNSAAKDKGLDNCTRDLPVGVLVIDI